MVDPAELAETNAYAKELINSGVNDEIRRDMQKIEIDDDAGLEQRDPTAQKNEHESHADSHLDRWYMIMVKKIHSKWWPFWILIWILDSVSLILYGVNKTKALEFYTQVFLTWNLCMGIASSAQFFYSWAKEKCCHKAGHPALSSFDSNIVHHFNKIKGMDDD